MLSLSALAVTRASDCEAYFFFKKRKENVWFSIPSEHWQKILLLHVWLYRLSSQSLWLLVSSRQICLLRKERKELTGDVKKEQDLSEGEETREK